MDLKKMLTNMGILGLFIFGMMAFIIITQINNEVSIPITNNTLINETYGSLSGNLTDAETQAQTGAENFGNVTVTRPLGELEVTSVISPTKVAKTIIVGLWNIFIKLPMVILGVSPAVASLISSLIVIFIVIGIWAIWKGVISS